MARKVRKGSIETGFTDEGYPWMVGVFAGISCSGVSAGEASVNGTLSKLVTCWTTNAAASGMTADEANGVLTCTRAGTYLVFFEATATGTANKTFEYVLHKNSSAQAFSDRFYQEAAQTPKHCGFVAPIVLAVNDTISVYKRGTDGTQGTSLVVSDAQLFAIRITS